MREMNLPCGGYTLKAVLTPGHTPAHMCFWMEETKTMFTGDHVLFDISPNITLWQEVDDSLGDYLESLKKIDKYDVKLALPGHRESGDFHARIVDLLEHHEKRLEECLDVVCSNPDMTIYDIAGKNDLENTLQFLGGLPCKPKVVCSGRMPKSSPPP